MLKLYMGITFFFSLLSYSIFAQEPGVVPGPPNDLDQQFVPDKNSILNSSNSRSTSASTYESTVFKNTIKFGVSLLARSTAAVFWEHRVSRVVFLEAGLGGSFGVDYVQKFFAEVEEAFGGNNNSNTVALNILLNNSAYAGGAGPFLSGGTRFYFSGDAPDGSYFNFNVRYAKYNMIYNRDPNNGITVNGDPNFSVQNLSFNFLYGYQVIADSWGRGSFVQDMQMGLGIRKTSYNGFYLPASSPPNNQYTYLPTGSRVSSLQPIFILSYSIGLVF